MGPIKNLIFVSITSYALFACSFFGRDDRLTFHQENYLGNELRTDGYFYEGTHQSGDRLNVYFLYRNGVILFIGSISPNEITEKERHFNDIKSIELRKETKYLWGLYKIKGDSIAFEKWYAGSGSPKPAYIRQGKIINDTTFVITLSKRNNGSEIRLKNEVYHFKKFTPKPDSTNVFIE